jgi:transposase
LPERYVPWARSYDLFRRWQRDGTWQRIFAELQAEADAKEFITGDLNIDSTVARAHQHAAGARERGTCRRSRPAGSVSSRTTTASAARSAA